jgi:hypothetical protein
LPTPAAPLPDTSVLPHRELLTPSDLAAMGLPVQALLPICCNCIF